MGKANCVGLHPAQRALAKRRCITLCAAVRSRRVARAASDELVHHTNTRWPPGPAR